LFLPYHGQQLTPQPRLHIYLLIPQLLPTTTELIVNVSLAGDYFPGKLKQEYEAVVPLDPWLNVDDLSACACKTRLTTLVYARRAAYVVRQIPEAIPE